MMSWLHGLAAEHFSNSGTTDPPDEASLSPRQRPLEALRSCQYSRPCESVCRKGWYQRWLSAVSQRPIWGVAWAPLPITVRHWPLPENSRTNPPEPISSACHCWLDWTLSPPLLGVKTRPPGPPDSSVEEEPEEPAWPVRPRLARPTVCWLVILLDSLTCPPGVV